MLRQRTRSWKGKSTVRRRRDGRVVVAFGDEPMGMTIPFTASPTNRTGSEFSKSFQGRRCA